MNAAPLRETFHCVSGLRLAQKSVSWIGNPPMVKLLANARLSMPWSQGRSRIAFHWRSSPFA